MSYALRVDDFLDRLNPVLVAEVRRALRGKTFVINFLVLQTIATIMAIAWATTTSDPDGRDFLRVLLLVLTFAAYVYVPLAAFQSMASEVDRGSLDHLLAPLRPWRVVLGKWLSSMTLLALLACACLPFASFALVAGGVDPRATLRQLLEIVVTSGTTTFLALWLAAVTANRSVRTLLLLALLLSTMLLRALLFRVLPVAAFTGIGWIFAPLGGYLYLGVGAFLAACARIAHPHENKSTPLRVWGTVGVLLMGFAWSGGSTNLEFAFLVLAVLWGMGVVFASEPDGDLRWFRRRIPRSRPLALLVAPWLPGGAFGGAWIVLNTTLLWIVSSPDWQDRRVLAVLSLLAWSLVILPTSLLPIVRRGVSTKFVRTFTFLLPFFLAAAADAVGALIGVQRSGILERVLELDLDRLDNDLGIFAVSSAALAVYVGGRRALAEWRVLEELRVGRR